MHSSSYTSNSRLRRLLAGPAARGLFVVAAFVVAVLNSPPGNPAAVGQRPEGPSAEEARVLDNLATWVLGAELEGELSRAVRERDLSFELFRQYAGDGVRSEIVTALPFGDAILRAGRRWGVDPLLLAAVVQAESGFDPGAVSVQGALGLMQVMPDTAALYRPSADLLDPRDNLEIGARYLATQLQQFDGDVPLALAAYNAGPGNVLRFAGIPPFAETRAYVRRVLASYVDHLQRSWRGSGELDWLVVDS